MKYKYKAVLCSEVSSFEHYHQYSAEMDGKIVRRWYHWYAPDDSPAERRLILKLDVLIIPYAFVIYWVKYIDQTNISKNFFF